MVTPLKRYQTGTLTTEIETEFNLVCYQWTWWMVDYQEWEALSERMGWFRLLTILEISAQWSWPLNTSMMITKRPKEESMSTHSSILVWRIPWTEEAGRLQSMGSQRVRHHWSDLACTHRDLWGPLFYDVYFNDYYFLACPAYSRPTDNLQLHLIS